MIRSFIITMLQTALIMKNENLFVYAETGECDLSANDFTCKKETDDVVDFSFSQCYKTCPSSEECSSLDCCDNPASIEILTLENAPITYSLASITYEDEIEIS